MIQIPKRAETLVDRAVMTGCQSVLGYSALTPFTDALSMDYRLMAGVFLGGALSSLLTNIARSGLSGRLSKEG